jgi:hypothetical protein
LIGKIKAAADLKKSRKVTERLARNRPQPKTTVKPAHPAEKL